MNYVVDVLLVAIAVITVFRCWRAGFAVSVLKFGRFFICFFGAILIASTFFGFIVTFVLLFLGVTILMSVMKLVTKIPIVHGFDKLLGIVFGLLCAGLYLSLISVSLYAILIGLNTVYSSSNALSVYDSSTVFKTVVDMQKSIRVVASIGL